ncbi:MAG: ribose 5-phosphate isomerase B [Coriobacteriales bacterium]|jgi:ribose 5-phosphate isomerase B|nr:ribose 5-phosphate isomerase B [Coriobacteriales bacterium]
MAINTIIIASDHAGFSQKQALVAWLREQAYQVNDLGPEGEGRVDYPDYAALVGRALVAGNADVGILICGTGIGMAIAANKIAGVRAANITDPVFAALAREHNDANVLALSGRFVDEATNRSIVETFLATPFSGGRHVGRLAKISALE